MMVTAGAAGATLMAYPMVAQGADWTVQVRLVSTPFVLTYSLVVAADAAVWVNTKKPEVRPRTPIPAAPRRPSRAVRDIDRFINGLLLLCGLQGQARSRIAAGRLVHRSRGARIPPAHARAPLSTTVGSTSKFVRDSTVV